MKVLLEIKEDKLAFVMELLSQLKFVKATPLTPYASEVLEGLKEAVEEVNRIKAGENTGRPLSDFLNEL